MEEHAVYRVLMVEDDRGIAQAVQTQGQLWNLEVRQVQDPRHVMEEFAAFDPHLVLLDIGLPCFEPKGAFYVMAALPVDDADAFQRWLLEEFQDNGDTVMFAPGEPFYATPGRGRSEIRIAYVLKQEDLERAMDLLALGIRAYNAR